MQDQVKILTSYGLKASYIGVDQNVETLKEIEQGLYTYIFLSPESALSNERWRNRLSSKVYQDRLVGLVVDEVHCMTDWGIS
jgi:ATP-dependent DNA helicase RecQ